MKTLTFKFFQDKKWYEDLGHFCIGFVPFLGWWREQNQWPPGDVEHFRNPETSVVEPYAPLDRVGDSYRDFLGYACGDIARTAIMLGVIIWLLV